MEFTGVGASTDFIFPLGLAFALTRALLFFKGGYVYIISSAVSLGLIKGDLFLQQLESLQEMVLRCLCYFVVLMLLHPFTEDLCEMDFTLR